MVKLTIPEIPPSLNEWCRWNRRKANEVKQQWGMLVKAYSRKQLGTELPCFRRAEVTLRYYFPTKSRRDPDNYSGKFIMDGLVDAGLLVDDSFENVDLKIVKGGVDKQNPRSEIEIVEVG